MWLFFLIPVSIVYLACVFSLYVAYSRLRRGISKTFLPRIQLLATNTANVFVLALYWFVFLAMYAWTYYSKDITVYNAQLFDILKFILASKGYSSFIVWIFITDDKLVKKFSEKDQTVDANKALREEVLSFATAGIRSTARSGPSLTPDRAYLIRRPQATKMASNPKISPLFFIKFMIGEAEQFSAMSNMMSVKRRSVNASFTRHTLGKSEFRATRLSQRPTMVTGSTLTKKYSDEFDEDESPTKKNTQRNHLVRSSFNVTMDHHVSDQIDMNTATHSHNNNNLKHNDLEKQGLSFNERMTSTSQLGQSEVSSRPSDMVEINDENLFSNHTLENNGGWYGIYHRCLQFLELTNTDEVEFVEFQPYHFRRVRLAAGITDDAYIK